jgi:hypothetical protein
MSLLLTAQSLHAADVWVFRNSEAVSLTGSCNTLETRDEIVLQNLAVSDVRVRVLGISNETPVDSGAQLAVPAGRTVTIDYARPTWFTRDTAARWWVVRLDVPDSVLVASRLDLGTVGCPLPQPPTFAPNRGRVALPVFRSLIAANTPQRHLSTDTGARNATLTAVIFNAGNSNAMAHVQLWRACDDTVVAERSLAIAANTVEALSLPLAIACETPARSVMANGFTYYTIVTMDQPSLSLVMSTANLAAPSGDVTVATMVPQAPAIRTRSARP